MHELSIAQSLVTTVSEAAADACAARVTRVVVRVGALTCVHADALRFAYEAAVPGTLLEGSSLSVVESPVVVFCAACDRELKVTSVQRLACPRCGAPSGDLRGGRELDLESIEIEDAEAPAGPVSDERGSPHLSPGAAP